MAWSMTRTLGRLFIPELFSMGLSASAGIGVLKKMGYSYRWQDFLADWREATGLRKLEPAFKFIPKKNKPSLSAFIPTETLIRTKYQYVYKATLTNKITGEEWYKYFRMGSETIQPVGHMEDLFFSRYKEYIEEVYAPDYVITKIEMTGALRRVS